jgi:hypothetical protein
MREGIGREPAAQVPLAHVSIRAVAHQRGPGLAAAWFDDDTGAVQLIVLAHRVGTLRPDELCRALSLLVRAALMGPLYDDTVTLSADRVEYGVSATDIPLEIDPLDVEAGAVTWAMTAIDHFYEGRAPVLARLAIFADRLVGAPSRGPSYTHHTPADAPDFGALHAVHAGLIPRIEHEPESPLRDPRWPASIAR